jgi:hypothetical protein
MQEKYFVKKCVKKGKETKAKYFNRTGKKGKEEPE